MKIKLKPCPFCGGRAKSIPSSYMIWFSAIACKCGAEVRFFCKQGTNVALVNPSGEEAEHNAMAREWNRRAKQSKRRGKG